MQLNLHNLVVFEINRDLPEDKLGFFLLQALQRLYKFGNH